MAPTLHWFRRDLRVRDNTALRAACAEGEPVIGVFVRDPRWFGHAEKMGPHQAAYWLACLRELALTLEARNIPLVFRTASDPVAALLDLAREAGAKRITYNKEYEPDQVLMDDRLETQAAAEGIAVTACKDAMLFEEQEILTGAGGTYAVFTPYKRAYLKKLGGEPPVVGGLPRRPASRLAVRSEAIPTSVELGYPAVELDVPPGEAAAEKQLERFIDRGLALYAARRDYPAFAFDGGGTSRLSAALNAGAVSIRQVIAAVLPAIGQPEQAPAGAAAAPSSAEVFLSELIWREFYRMILFHFPRMVSRPFDQRYNALRWSNHPARAAAWREGRTGYPIVDAAMRQLAATGFMHNRLRMIAAMFLTKDLDCHWILGERFFMKSLVDFDQACNVGGWQWSASTGTDAAPYFRIMNPVLQSQRYDADGLFLRHWLPALRSVPARFLHAPWTMPPAVQRESGCIIGRDYPAPLIDHAAAKAAAIAKFRSNR